MLKTVTQLIWKAYRSVHLNKVVVRLHALVRPPPYQRDNIEFERDVWNGICTFYADNGRQVGENNTNPPIYRELIPTRHKTCPFEGSRLGRQVNITALRPMIGVWDDVLQFTALLRNRYLEHRRFANPRFNLCQGYAFSKLGAGYLSYLARRAINPLKSGTLPPLETAFFTVGVGPFMVVRALMEKGNLAALNSAPLSAADIYALVDSSGSLLAGDDRACAGSKHLIMQFLDVAMNGRYSKPLNSIAAQQAMARIDDWTNFFRYITASSRLELLLKLNQALCAQQLLTLLSDPTALTPSLRDQVRACLRLCYYKTDSPLDDGTVLRHFILIVLALLNELAYPEVRNSLVQALLLDDGGAHTPLATKGNRAVIERIHAVTVAIFPWCRTELVQMNESLGRTAAKPITIEDLYRRAGGADLLPLLAALARGQTSNGTFRIEIPGFDTVLIRPLQLDADMVDLHDWFGRDYARFWNLQDKSLAAVQEIYRALLSRQGFEVLIGWRESSGAKAFLLESYRPDQDELGHYYRAKPTDRGCHFFMAPATTAVNGFSYHMLGVIADCVFADPSVQRIVAEPDIRNAKVIARLIQRGFTLGRVAHLPNKTAQLVFLSRDRHARRRNLPAGRKPRLPLHMVSAHYHVFAGRVIRKLRRLWLAAMSSRHP